MSWIGPGGQSPVFSASSQGAPGAPTFPNALVAQVTAQSVKGNDVCGLITLTTSAAGVAAATLITTINFPVALPASTARGAATVALPANVYAFVQSQDDGTAATLSTIAFTARINAAGQLEIRTGAAATGAAITTFNLAYFIIGHAR